MRVLFIVKLMLSRIRSLIPKLMRDDMGQNNGSKSCKKVELRLKLGTRIGRRNVDWTGEILAVNFSP